MSMFNARFCVILSIGVSLVFMVAPAIAGFEPPCACSQDVSGLIDEEGCNLGPDGEVTIGDVQTMTAAVGGNLPTYCDETDPLDLLDFNCDGVIDSADFDAFICLGTDPQEICCVDITVAVPTVSSWGVVAMALLTLTAGSLMFRRSHLNNYPTAT